MVGAAEQHDNRRGARCPSGGAWRFIQRDAEGNAYEFYGEYLEVTPNEKVVYTFEFAGFPGHLVTDTVTFVPAGAGTRSFASSSFASKEDLDGMLATGMEGARQRELGPSGRVALLLDASLNRARGTMPRALMLSERFPDDRCGRT